MFIRGKVSYTINLTIVDHTLGLIIVVKTLFTLSHLCIFLTLEVCWCSLPWLLSMASAHHICRSPRVFIIPQKLSIFIWKSLRETAWSFLTQFKLIKQWIEFLNSFTDVVLIILTRVLDTCAPPSAAVSIDPRHSRGRPWPVAGCVGRSSLSLCRAFHNQNMIGEMPYFVTFLQFLAPWRMETQSVCVSLLHCTFESCSLIRSRGSYQKLRESQRESLRESLWVSSMLYKRLYIKGFMWGWGWGLYESELDSMYYSEFLSPSRALKRVKFKMKSIFEPMVVISISWIRSYSRPRW